MNEDYALVKLTHLSRQVVTQKKWDYAVIRIEDNGKTLVWVAGRGNESHDGNYIDFESETWVNLYNKVQEFLET